MPCWILIVILVLVAAALWAYLVWPSSVRSRADKWRGTSFAHRGLHADGIPENTLSAFGKAVEGGYGMELDVRYTKDKKIVVCHDDDLKRVMGIEKKISELTLAQLREYRFPGTDETDNV